MFKRVQSRDELIEYALRENGHPVVQINIAQEQLEDRVNDALHMFFRYHMDATRRDVITIKLTQEDIEKQELALPKDVISVIDMVYTPASTFSMNNLQYQMYFSDLISKTFTFNGLSSYTMTRSYLSTITEMIGNIHHIHDFNIHSNTVKIFYNWSIMKPGDFVGMEVQRALNPDSYADVWDNYWLKKYTSALVKKQWGGNLMKYQIPALVGGASINGTEIYQSAIEDINNLEQRLVDEFQFPVMGFMA